MTYRQVFQKKFFFKKKSTKPVPEVSLLSRRSGVQSPNVHSPRVQASRVQSSRVQASKVQKSRRLESKGPEPKRPGVQSPSVQTMRPESSFFGMPCDQKHDILQNK